MNTTPPTHATQTARGWRWLAWLGAGLLLLAVFALYQRPDFLRQLADQVWSCF